MAPTYPLTYVLKALLLGTLEVRVAQANNNTAADDPAEPPHHRPPTSLLKARPRLAGIRATVVSSIFNFRAASVSATGDFEDSGPCSGSTSGLRDGCT